MMIKFKKLSFLFLLASFIINLNAQSLSFLSNVPYVPPGLNLEPDQFGEVGDYYYRYIKFESLPKSDAQKRMQNKGLILLEYIGKNTYVGAIHHSFPRENQESYGILWTKHIPSQDKIHDNLLERPLKAHAVKGNMVDILIQYYKNVPAQVVESELMKKSIRINSHNKHNNFVAITVPIEDIQQISFMNFVAFLDIAPEPGTPDDNNGRGMHRANVISADYLGGRKYDGSGIKVQVRDDGVLGPHIDYHGRLLNDYTQYIGGDHSDGVAGIFTGAGNLNPRFRGMATGADLYNTDYQSNFLDITLDLHLDENVLVTNSSYSDGCNAGYTNVTKIVDQQMFENPTYMHVFSAGNSNNNECGYGAGTQWGNITGGHKQGKNVIATANLDVDGYLSNSSSRGPAHDGRIKPDISAHGAGHMSTGTGNTYDPFGGTSAASPGIAGVFTMLHSAYQELNDNETAEAALIKACLLNSANDIGNQGPDFKFGWGLVNALKAARILEDNRYLSAEIEQEGSNTHTFEIPENVAQAKIMLYWADRDASTNANIALVNNLDATVTDNTGEVFYPWILNTTPDPALLNEPATTGVDNLNNVEQVALFNPEAGTYTFNISGTEIPFGPVKYYVVYEFIYDELEVIYPIGGEALVPGETENIHWDAPRNNTAPFSLSYSTDNGSTWNNIGSAGPNRRQLSWQIPSEVSGQCLVKVGRDGMEDISDFNFTIAEVPQNIVPVQVCPNSMTLTWDPMDAATSYEGFLLGEKYMDSVAVSSTNTITIPIDNPLEDNWYAIRALGDNNMIGQRSIAQLYNQNIFNCQLGADAQLSQIVTSLPNNIIACSDYANNLEIEIYNNGSADISSLQVAYQLDNNPIAVGTTNAISIGETIQYTFDDQLEINTNGTYQLKVWLEYPGDEYLLNDTITTELEVTILGVGTIAESINEDFESAVFPPQDWIVQNPDNDISWEDWSTIGSDGQFTSCTRINNYNYSIQGQEDEFISIPFFVNPDNENPELSFDLAYAYYSSDYYDGLRIEISNCGGTFNEVVYFKEYTQLATAGGISSAFEPNSASDWRTETIDLTPYVGEDVIIRFINVNGYGNNLFIDNINLFPDLLPVASFSTSTENICVGEAVTFTNTSDNFEELTWNFGLFSNPSTATGEGPHDVLFNLAGNQTVTLTASNSSGTNTITQNYISYAQPVANFDFSIDGNTISFSNNSLNTTSVSWDFGSNGAGSNQSNPSFTYDESGSYNVQLIASNQYCSPDTVLQTINIVSVQETDNTYTAGIAPNPNNGNFMLSINGTVSDRLDLNILDLTGKTLHTEVLNPINGNLVQKIDVGNLPAGIYILKIQSEIGSKNIKVIIE
jgi:PKD repeat protein